jgi:DNA-directed RNA polymerase subunit L
MITNYKESTITLPNIPEEYKAYKPRMLDQECSFTITGINNAIAGAIIRTIGGELPVKYLRCDTVETNDRFIIEEQVASRIMSIPIKQSLAEGTKFNLSYTNKSQFLETIKTSHFDGYPATGSVPFNGNITVCKLNKSSAKITKDKLNPYLNIKAVVASAPSYIPTFGCLSLAYQYVALPVENAFDQYAKTGIRTSVSNADTYDIKFYTHGTINPRELLIMTCDNIIKRINRVSDFIPMKSSQYDTHTYTVVDDSETIGNLFMREILDTKPVKSASYKMGLDTRVVNIIVCGDNTDQIMKEVIKDLASKFDKIKKSF